jgi:HIV Tat-specific factor 1
VHLIYFSFSANPCSQLADWSDDEEEVGRKLTPKKNVWQRICILRHAFTLEELAEDEEAIKDIKTEIRERASKFGDVSNVTLYDLEEQGIMTVKFREHGSAEKFCAAAEGMAWGDMRLESMIPEGRFRYRKTGKGDDVAPSPEDTTSTPEDSTSHE